MDATEELGNTEAAAVKTEGLDVLAALGSGLSRARAGEEVIGFTGSVSLCNNSAKLFLTVPSVRFSSSVWPSFGTAVKADLAPLNALNALKPPLVTGLLGVGVDGLAGANADNLPPIDDVAPKAGVPVDVAGGCGGVELRAVAKADTGGLLSSGFLKNGEDVDGEPPKAPNPEAGLKDEVEPKLANAPPRTGAGGLSSGVEALPSRFGSGEDGGDAMMDFVVVVGKAEDLINVVPGLPVVSEVPPAAALNAEGLAAEVPPNPEFAPLFANALNPPENPPLSVEPWPRAWGGGEGLAAGEPPNTEGVPLFAKALNPPLDVVPKDDAGADEAAGAVANGEVEEPPNGDVDGLLAKALNPPPLGPVLVLPNDVRPCAAKALNPPVEGTVDDAGVAVCPKDG